MWRHGTRLVLGLRRHSLASLSPGGGGRVRLHVGYKITGDHDAKECRKCLLRAKRSPKYRFILLLGIWVALGTSTSCNYLITYVIRSNLWANFHTHPWIVKHKKILRSCLISHLLNYSAYKPCHLLLYFNCSRILLGRYWLFAIPFQYTPMGT